VYLLVFHAYINETHGSRSKIPSKKSRPFIYDVKFLDLLGATYIYIYIYMCVCVCVRARARYVSEMVESVVFLNSRLHVRQ
jgi:hypothetical protein